MGIAYQLAMSGIAEGAYLESSGTYTLLSSSEWVGNLGVLPATWVNSFMIVSPADLDMVSIQGIVVVLATCFALLAGFAPLVYVGYRKVFDSMDWLLEACAIVVWGVVVLQFVCFRGPEPRMLYPAIMVNLLLLGVMAVRGRGAGQLTRPCAVGAIICAAAGVVLYAAMLATANWTANVGITQELAAHDLHYGFASFWNSNINTVNSGNEVKVRSILINENAVSPFVFQSEGAWYDSTTANPDGSSWFLLLTADEWEGMRQVSNDLPAESCSEHFQIGDEYHVLVFDAEQWGPCLSGAVNVVGK